MIKNIFITILIFVMAAFLLESCSRTDKTGNSSTNKNMTEKVDTAVLGAGCFWCTQAIYERLKGVKSIEAGYSGGTIENPTYQQVCLGSTGYAEVARIIFDPSVISYKQLLDIFWTIHDPTSLNKQGPDVGEQYRSVIFYANDEQKEAAEKSKKEVAATLWNKPIVTEISPLKNFYTAEKEHQEYFGNHPYAPYCETVINPKVVKFSEKFKDWLK
jgi:peptide-methionine (S)-S-oxide reductase